MFKQTFKEKLNPCHMCFTGVHEGHLSGPRALLIRSVRMQDARKPFVAYFGAAGTLGRPRMHAWMSRSTHGLRERLRAEPHGLVFSAPLAPGADVSARDERMQAELKEASQMVSCNASPYRQQPIPAR